MKNLVKIATAALLLAFLAFSLAACAIPFLGDSAKEYFLYEENEDGTLTVIGLTDDGKAQTELTVPAEIDGKKVTILGKDGASVFAGASSLKTVTINDNITYVASGVFGNCPSLQTVILNTEPNKTSTHFSDLLENASDNLRFSAKTEYLTSYYTDYYWSTYASRFDFAEE